MLDVHLFDIIFKSNEGRALTTLWMVLQSQSHKHSWFSVFQRPNQMPLAKQASLFHISQTNGQSEHGRGLPFVRREPASGWSLNTPPAVCTQGQ